MSQSPPRPPEQWLIGSYHHFQRDRLAFLQACRPLGDLVETHFFGQKLYLINHPEDIRRVLVEHADHFPKLNARDQGGLADLAGEAWQRRNRLIRPAFHYTRVQNYADTMITHTDHALQTWHDGQTIDLHAVIHEITMQIAASILLSADLSDMGAEIAQLIAKGQAFLSRGGGILAALSMIGDLGQFQTYKRLRERLIALVRARRITGEDRGDLLSMLILAHDEHGDQLTDQEAADEALGLFIAGHETTANALTWTLYLLAEHPTIQAALQAELERVIGDRLPTVNDVLPYTDAVIKESLRLYPPAWVIMRRIRGAISLQGYPLDSRGLIAISPYTLHRDPRFYPDPERFDPTRWIESDPPRYHFLPFGGGQRICIGREFALLELRLLLSLIAHRWAWSRAEQTPITPEPLVTLRPKQAIQLTLKIVKTGY
ncbi:MAG: cytochrome P450 [Anaerolineae bacterium]|jgi:cytochrome P450|nr:cytochrome P450 [Anaerolineae bacterium]